MPKFVEYDLSVCTVCAHLIANGEFNDGTDAAEIAQRGMDAKWGPLQRDIVSGGPHSDECTDEDRNEGCDCGDLGFSTSECDTCGDTDHGDRFQATALLPWLNKENRHSYLNGYITAMLWANLDDGTDNGERGSALPLDHWREQLTWQALTTLVRDALAFLDEQYADLLWATMLLDSRMDEFSAWNFLGADFALTRCGHGVGYWDRDLGDVGERLTSAAHVHNETMLYIGDDDRIYP